MMASDDGQWESKADNKTLVHKGTACSGFEWVRQSVVRRRDGGSQSLALLGATIVCSNSRPRNM